MLYIHFLNPPPFFIFYLNIYIYIYILFASFSYIFIYVNLFVDCAASVVCLQKKIKINNYYPTLRTITIVAAFLFFSFLTYKRETARVRRKYGKTYTQTTTATTSFFPLASLSLSLLHAARLKKDHHHQGCPASYYSTIPRGGRRVMIEKEGVRENT
eukprot:gene8041-5594_t